MTRCFSPTGCLYPEEPTSNEGILGPPRDCQTEAEMFANSAAALDRWTIGKRYPQLRQFVYFLVTLNRLHYGPRPDIVLTADVRDVVFQADVRALLHEHASYRYVPLSH